MRVDIGTSTLLLGDCYNILESTGLGADLILTDPPYGISLQTDYKKRGRGNLAVCRDFAEIQGDDRPFDPEFLFQYSEKVVTWGSNYYSNKLPPSSGWLVWDKRVLEITNDQADCELAYTNCVKGVRIFRHMWNGFLRDSERGEGYHAAQKPVALMEWVLSLINPTSVLDPFMGSGPVGVACANRGIPYIGIEIDKTYFETAKNRITEASKQMNLFI